MFWYWYLAYFFAGAFLANGIPHFVSGLMGRAFPSPFASPPGVGLSSATVNVFWGFFNLAVAYLLLFHVGEFAARDFLQACAFGLGMLLLAWRLAVHFGRHQGDNSHRA